TCALPICPRGAAAARPAHPPRRAGGRAAHARLHRRCRLRVGPRAQHRLRVLRRRRAGGPGGHPLPGGDRPRRAARARGRLAGGPQLCHTPEPRPAHRPERIDALMARPPVKTAPPPKKGAPVGLIGAVTAAVVIVVAILVYLAVRGSGGLEGAGSANAL